MTQALSVGAWFDLDVDTTPPTILNVQILGKTATGFAVDWNTDEATTGGVNYGTTHSYGTYVPDEGSAATDHRVVLDGLARKTTYYFRVTATDVAGNTAQSDEFSVTTESRLPRPPKVTGVSATEGSVILSWQSPSDYEHLAKIVIYRRADTYTQIPDPEYQMTEVSATTTTWKDADTQPSTTYYYTLFSVDDESKYSDPEFVSFITSGPPVSAPRGGGGGGGSSGGGGRGTTTYYYSRTNTDPLTLLRIALLQWLQAFIAQRQGIQVGGGATGSFTNTVSSPAPLSGGTTNAEAARIAQETVRARLQAFFRVLTQVIQVLSTRSGAN